MKLLPQLWSPVITLLITHFVLIQGKAVPVSIIADGVKEYNIDFRAINYLKEAVKELSETKNVRRSNLYNCPSPYDGLAGHCLYFVHSGGTLEESRIYCSALAGDLAVFKSVDLLKILIVYMNRDFVCDYRVGASRRNSTSEFQWLDGTSLPEISSPFWNYIDNDNFNCVALMTRGSAYKLENIDCSDAETRTLCQYEG